MNHPLTRRQWLLRMLALPAGAWMTQFHSLAQAHRGKVKLAAVKAMQVKNIAGNCLIKIETDSGLIGYGEAGSSGPMARSRINDQLKNLLVGKDPLAIEPHFLNMISLMHPYMAHIPTISGIDIALWDLAGKITGQPVVLLGGPLRDAIRLYSHGPGNILLDPPNAKTGLNRSSPLRKALPPSRSVSIRYWECCLAVTRPRLTQTRFSVLAAASRTPVTR